MSNDLFQAKNSMKVKIISNLKDQMANLETKKNGHKKSISEMEDQIKETESHIEAIRDLLSMWDNKR